MKGELKLALLKISKGMSANLPNATTEGQIYFTIDQGEFYIDMATTESASPISRSFVNGLAYVAGSSAGTDGAWVANHQGLKLRDGLAFIYKPAVNGSNLNEYEVTYTNEENAETSASLSYTCLNLNNTGWKKCYLNPQRPLRDEYLKETMLLIVYNSSLENGVGGWIVIGTQIEDKSAVEGITTTSIIKEDAPDEIPTSGAVIDYIKSLQYNGEYELTNSII